MSAQPAPSQAGGWLPRLAIGAGVPTAQLTGETPKFSNMFADRIQFARSESGILAREVCAAAMPVLAAITAGTPDAGAIFWLNPAPLIEEALTRLRPWFAARRTAQSAPTPTPAPTPTQG